MTRLRGLLVLSIACVALGACAPAVGSGADGSPATTATPAPSATWEGEMLARINAERAAVGAAPLQLCGTLTMSAQAHSQDQAATDNMSHTGSNGSTMRQRDEAAGYRGWTFLAENVAAGYRTVQSVMDGWMGSSGHRTNLLGTSYVHVGLGRATSASGQLYWTQEFGRSGSC